MTRTAAPIPSHAIAPVRELAQTLDETRPRQHYWGLGHDGAERCMRCDVSRIGTEREREMCRRNGG